VNQRRDFFSFEATESELTSQAGSDNPDDRWLAAIQLGQIHELWSARILWRLKEDPDESTKNASVTAIRNFPVQVLNLLDPSASSSNNSFEPVRWKVRPLPKFEAAVRELYGACVLDILTAEGPTTGGRIYRLLSQASAAAGVFPPSRIQIKDLVAKLFSQGTVSRVDKHFDSQMLDLWILNISGYPEIVIREREGREIIEIPVNEAQGVLRQDSRFMRRPNPEMGWEVLKRQYSIQRNEFHLVGEALENQWQGLFNLG
jgi:hypothetical protein